MKRIRRPGSWHYHEDGMRCVKHGAQIVYTHLSLLRFLLPSCLGENVAGSKKKKIGRPSSVEWKKMRFGCAMTH